MPAILQQAEQSCGYAEQSWGQVLLYWRSSPMDCFPFLPALWIKKRAAFAAREQK